MPSEHSMKIAQAQQHQQELDALTVRLEQAEEKCLCQGEAYDRLRAELDGYGRELADRGDLLGRVRVATGAGTWPEAVERVEQLLAENRRLLASLHEEQRQRAEIDAALGMAVAPLDAVIAEIRRLQEGQPEPEPEGEPLDLVALPRPDDLPAAWLFRYVRYGLEQTEAMTDLVDRISGVAG